MRIFLCLFGCLGVFHVEILSIKVCIQALFVKAFVQYTQAFKSRVESIYVYVNMHKHASKSTNDFLSYFRLFVQLCIQIIVVIAIS